MAWAFARENGLPGSTFLAKVTLRFNIKQHHAETQQVQTRTALPLSCIGLSTIISLLLALINIGSSTAFNALTSLVIASFYSTYIISASVLLHKRLTAPSDIKYGPFTMGRAGVPIAILAIAYSILGLFFSFWPPTPAVTAETMNWSVLVYGAAVLFSLGFWVVHGRKVYTGPIMEVTLQ